MNLPSDPESRSRRPRRAVFLALTTLFGLSLSGFFYYWSDSRDIRYEDKPIGYWEQQVLSLLPQGGKEAEVDTIVKKMGPEATPFWLTRMQTKDSPLQRGYIRIWSALPIRLRAVLPEPVPQRKRRNVAHYVLSKMNYTNGIPELIALSYSKDSEIQEYAVHLLWYRAYQFYYPSETCIEAFGHVLRNSNNVRTRQWAVAGLGILPLHEEALPALEIALYDSDRMIRTKAEEIIRQIQEKNPRRPKHVFD